MCQTLQHSVPLGTGRTPFQVQRGEGEQPGQKRSAARQPARVSAQLPQPQGLPAGSGLQAFIVPDVQGLPFGGQTGKPAVSRAQARSRKLPCFPWCAGKPCQGRHPTHRSTHWPYKRAPPPSRVAAMAVPPTPDLEPAQLQHLSGQPRQAAAGEGERGEVGVPAPGVALHRLGWKMRVS